ncbi:hypothetical protein ACYZT9_15045 [Pseudomonas sp. ZT5P21]
MTIKINTGLSAPVPMYICHGAEGEQCHTLSIKPDVDSPWVNQQFSCHDIVGDPSSLIRVEPERGEFQNFPLAGAELKLHCPANGQDRDLELRLRSEFTAKPYVIALKLGHYRCDFKSKRPPIGAPVIGQKVTAAVTVESFYTKAAVENVNVVWTIGEQVITVPTSSAGVSEFTHTVANEGTQTITATLYNPYNDETKTEEFSFKGYSSSPWEQAKLFINGKEVKFGAPVGLIRGVANEITVEAPLEIAQQLMLGLADAGGLNVQASPDFETPVNPEGGKFTWQIITGAGISGFLILVFFSREVLIPWELPCWVISGNLADEVKNIVVDGVASPPAEILFFRNEPQTVALTYKPGSPLNGLPLQLVGTPLTGVQPGNLVVTPTEESPNHTWIVKSHTDSGTFQLELKGLEGTRGITLPVCKVMSRAVGDEVESVLLDDKPYLGDAVLFRDEPRTVALKFKPNSPAGGYPYVANAVPVSNLQPADMKVTPVPANPNSWTAEVVNKSGIFKIVVSGPDIISDLTLPDTRVLSQNLTDEGVLKIDGVVPEANHLFFRGKARTVEFVPRAGSPVAGWPVTLRCAIKTGLDPANVVSSPAFGTPQTTYRWGVTGSTKSGTFQLSLAGKDMTTPITGPVSTLLSDNPAHEFDAKIDNVLIPEEGVEFTGGTARTLTLTPKAGSPVVGHPMMLQWGGASIWWRRIS